MFCNARFHIFLGKVNRIDGEIPAPKLAFFIFKLQENLQKMAGMENSSAIVKGAFRVPRLYSIWLGVVVATERRRFATHPPREGQASKVTLVTIAPYRVRRRQLMLN